jgi:hypothetical protein
MTREELFNYCIENKKVGVGFSRVDTRQDKYPAIFEQAQQYDNPTRCVKAVNAIRNMRLDDLIWTRLDGIYYLCKVRELWRDLIPTDTDKEYDIPNHVKVDWLKVGTEDTVPGKVISSFRSPAAVQKVHDVDLLFKAIWNEKSGCDYFSLEEFNEGELWNALTSEMIEEIVFIYLQCVHEYIVYTSTVKKNTAKTEGVLVRRDGAHRAFLQVKSGHSSLNAKDYISLVENNKMDIVYLFAASGKYYQNNYNQIKCLEKEVLETFIKDNIDLIPLKTKYWIKALGLL